MEPGNNIQQLPSEIRCMIWSEVGQTDGYKQLLRTNRLIRSDILSHIPGVGLSCQCPQYKPCKCGKSIDIRRLNIIVEPDYSAHSWLKFSVSMFRGQWSSWKVESLDDMLAQPLRYLRPKEICIDFQAPKKGYYQMSFLILRAKLFDVCSVLDLVQAQKQRSLYLHFSDPWANSGRGPNKPFWEHRPPAHVVKKDAMRRLLNVDFRPLLKNVRMVEKRDAFLYFYEMILTPFCMHWAWRNAKVTFDREPKSKSTSFITPTVVAGRQHIVYHGAEALILTAWAYNEQLMQEGTIEKSEEECVPEFENHEAIRTKWASQELHHSSWKKALECYLNFVIANSESFQRIMSVKMPQTANLPETIWRHKDNSPRDAFSEVHPGSAKGAGNTGFEVGTWTWNHDIIRRRYHEWAELWDNSLDGLFNPSGSFKSFYSIDMPFQYTQQIFPESLDEESESIPFEEFRAFHLRYTWPLSWKWQLNPIWKCRRYLDSSIQFYKYLQNLV